jgi:hypothetical protein
MVVMLALGALSLAGSLIGGFGKKKAGDAAAKAATANALLAEEGARITEAGTTLDLSRMTRAGFKTQGAIQAGAGASGLKTSGSALDVLRSSAANIALDKQLRGMQGALDAMGYKSRAIDYRAQAAGAKAEGNAGLAQGILKGASGLLSGGLI